MLSFFYQPLFSDTLRKLKGWAGNLCVWFFPSSSLVLMSRPRFGFRPPALFTSCTEQVILLIFCTPMFEKHLERIALWQQKISLYCVLSAVCTVWPTCRRMKIVGIKPWESTFGGECHCLAWGIFWRSIKIVFESSSDCSPVLKKLSDALLSLCQIIMSHKSIVLLTRWWLRA